MPQKLKKNIIKNNEKNNSGDGWTPNPFESQTDENSQYFFERKTIQMPVNMIVKNT